jgi:type II secretory pathway pseudopilin PulG
VSIIALLIAILLPSLKGARDQAKLTVCMSNQKQLALAFAYYGEDFAQNPPPNRQFGGTAPEYSDSDWWFYSHMVPKYVPPNKRSQTNSAFAGIFECPADPTAGRAYAMNLMASNYPWKQKKPDNTWEVVHSDATPYNPDRSAPFNPFNVKSSYKYILVGEAHAVYADASNPGLYGTRYVICAEKGAGSGIPWRSVYEAFFKVAEDGSDQGGRGPYYGFIDFKRHRGPANFLLSDLHVESLTRRQIAMADPENPGKWISSLRVLWSALDSQPTVNRPTPP